MTRHSHHKQPEGGRETFKEWLDSRLPVFSALERGLVRYRVPRNLNYMWSFGSLAGLALLGQIVTGIVLAFHYKADAGQAFASVQTIMRSVDGGALMRDLHRVGASFVFVAVYLHMARSLYYGSYKSPREVLWILGVLLLLLLMTTAFVGGVLPWSQLSYVSATVMTGVFAELPLVGNSLHSLLVGGPLLGDATLVRFYVLHLLLPTVIVAVILLHLWALRQHGSNNPAGIDLRKSTDFVPFHPYYTVKDALTLGVFLIPFMLVVFFVPDLLVQPEAHLPADPRTATAHAVPEWYFLPFYAMLRAMPLKGLGIGAMLGSLLILFCLPWLDRSPVRSARFRPVYRVLVWLFFANFLLLGYVGAQPVSGWYVPVAQLATAYYFLFFAVLPLVAKYEKPRRLPETI